MPGRRWEVAYMALTTAVLACGSGDEAGDDARARGHAVADLARAQEVGVYRAAVAAAFDVGPDLHLLVEPTHLPRSSGFAGGTPVPEVTLAALEDARVVQGRCIPRRASDLRAPSCEAPRVGYVTRFSEIFQLGGDTVEVYVHSEVYAPAGGAGQQPFAFEMAYQLVPQRRNWRVVREGRVRQSGSDR